MIIVAHHFHVQRHIRSKHFLFEFMNDFKQNIIHFYFFFYDIQFRKELIEIHFFIKRNEFIEIFPFILQWVDRDIHRRWSIDGRQFFR